MKGANTGVLRVVMLAGALGFALAGANCASSKTVADGTGGTSAGSGGSMTGTGGHTTGTGGTTGTTGTGGATTTIGTGGTTGTTGTGGATTTTGTGGAVSGTGGVAVLDCSSPVSVGSTGLLTDFSPTYWSNTTGKWGMAPLTGSKFSYAGPTVVDAAMSTATATVDTTMQDLHFTATVEPAGYAGVGLSFDECATAGTTFNAIQFTLLGTTGGCALEMQVQTFDQKPNTDKPAGGCASSCQNYPKKTNLPLPASATVASTVVVGFNATDLSGWAAGDAAELVGLQWQVTVPSPPDGGAQTACTVDLRIDDVTLITQ